MPDDNDIVFTTYGPDLVQAISNGILRASQDTGWVGALYAWLQTAWAVYTVIALLLSVLFIIGIIYSYIRYNQLAEIEANQLLEAERLWREVYGSGRAGNSQWQQIQHHLNSTNPNDWKLAIIEADIMLERVLDASGFAGNSVGDKLKSASVHHFATLQDAWDAHLIRNKIAHEGSDFVLTQRIAQEAIVKYERVFREFDAL